jgi:hypothetical protein
MNMKARSVIVISRAAPMTTIEVGSLNSPLITFLFGIAHTTSPPMSAKVPGGTSSRLLSGLDWLIWEIRNAIGLKS